MPEESKNILLDFYNQIVTQFATSASTAQQITDRAFLAILMIIVLVCLILLLRWIYSRQRDFDKQLTSKERRISDLESKYSTVIDEFNQYKLDRTNAQIQRDEDYSKLKGDYEKIVQDYKNLSESSEAEKTDLLGKHKDLLKRHDTLIDTLEKEQAARRIVENKKSNLQMTLNAERTEHTQTKNDRDALLIEKDVHINRIKVYEENERVFRKQISDLQSQVKRLQEQVEHLERQLNEKSSTVEHIEDES